MADEQGALVVRDRRGQRRQELRDPSAATGNLGYRARGMPLVAQWDAAQAMQWAYYANTIVYRCVQVTANALSRVPFRVGADPNKPASFDPRAPLALLLGPAPGGPNQETSARQLWAWTVAQYLVTGRFGWENELDDRDRPVALWPLPSSSLHPIPSSGGARYFDRYEFGPPTNRKKLRAEQVTYGWRPSAQDWREPESALQAARMDISVAVMQDRYDYAFLRNGARPDFMIVHEAFEDDDQTDAFRAQFLAEHRGPDNAGKPAFVESLGGGDKGVTGAIDVKQLGLSQKDAQALQRYEHKVRQICLALGTPLSKLGDASGRTFDNAGQEDRNWYQETVQPLGDELADVVNIKLAPLLGSNVGWFDWPTVPALRPPRKFATANPVELVQAEIVDVNEVRGELELPDRDPATPDDGPALLPQATAFKALVEGGLTHASAALLTGLDVTVLEVAAAPTAVIPAQAPARDRLRAAEEALAAARAAAAEARATGPETREATDEDREQAARDRRDNRWKSVDQRTTSLEKTWQRAMTRLFARQEQATLARLTGKRGRQMLTAALTAAEGRAPDDPAPQVDPADIFDPEFWTTDTADVASGLYETIAAVAGQDIAERFGVAFDLSARYVTDFIEARANQLAGHVTDTTYRAIQKALADGVLEGLGIDELAGRVRHVFDVASTSRAVTIARTEVISAYNGAATLEAAQLPEDVVAGKEWVATRDSRVREEHADADGQTVRVAEPFDVGGEQIDYPGDGSAENSINCRCTVAFLTPDEMPTDRSRRIDERAARAAFRVVRAGWLDPDDLPTRLKASA